MARRPPVPLGDLPDWPVGDPAAPLAPDGDIIIASSETSPDIAPIADTPLISAPAPSSRPRAPEVDTSSPESEPEPEVVDVAPPEPAPAPEAEVTPPKPQPEPEQQVAAAPTVATPEAPTSPQIDTSSPEPEPEPEEPPAEEEVSTQNDPDIPAPKVAPPPPRKAARPASG